jgi:hypothetical protein
MERQPASLIFFLQGKGCILQALLLPASRTDSFPVPSGTDSAGPVTLRKTFQSLQKLPWVLKTLGNSFEACRKGSGRKDMGE